MKLLVGGHANSTDNVCSPEVVQKSSKNVKGNVFVAKTLCSGCGMCEDVALECANSGECIRQILEYPHQHHLSREKIEQIERDHFPELLAICHTEVKPRPFILQKLWENCSDL